MMSEKTSDEPSALSRILAATSFAVTVIVIGVPVWLKTTQVYRAHVPYSEIDQLKTLSFDRSYSVRVQLVADTDSHLWLSRLRACNFSVQLKSREWTREELLLLKSGGVWNLERHTDSDSLEHSSVNFFLLPDSHVSDGGAANIWLGKGSNVFFTRSYPAHSLCRFMSQFYSETSEQTSSITRVKTAGKYRLVVSVVVPDVDSGNVPTHTTVQLCQLLQPLITQLRPLANITVISQYLHNVNFNSVIRHNSSANQHYIDEQSMSLLVTPIEAGLGSYISSDTTINFVLYVVPGSRRPLHITTTAGAVTAFISPRWGAVQLINRLPLDTASTVAVITSQLRQLLGVSQLTVDSDDVIKMRPARLRSWELEAVRQRRTVENLENCRRNLVSLSSMLAQISNIVISDHVAHAVSSSLHSLHRSLSCLHSSQHQSAYLHSLRALQLSQTAIYDPSMLALLYFPDDQKYAIYIPLFLPVSIPVIASLGKIFKYVKIAYGKSKVE